MLRRHFVSVAGHNVRKHKPNKGDKVVVALSGGVDSSVAAKLLADQDYDLSAVYMRNWDTADESGSDLTGCQWKKDWEDVQKVSRHLGLPVELVDLSSEYWSRVFEPAVRDWQDGITPNPDVWCNRHIKFGALLSRTSKLTQGAWLATGHYADTGWRQQAHGPRRLGLLRPHDRLKDQTYYLSSIPETPLSRVHFPLSNLTKVEVREIAKLAKLPTAEREESMGLCFVGERKKFSAFLANYVEPRDGLFVHHLTGEKLGNHQGLWNYTIGQGARLPGMKERLFVAMKDVEKNEIRLVPGSEHSALYTSALHCYDWRWIWSDSPPPESTTAAGFVAATRFRHKMKDTDCITFYSPDTSHLKMQFKTPQLAVALGQVAAVWDGPWCLGCGTIAHTEPYVE